MQIELLSQPMELEIFLKTCLNSTHHLTCLASWFRHLFHKEEGDGNSTFIFFLFLASAFSDHLFTDITYNHLFK